MRPTQQFQSRFDVPPSFGLFAFALLFEGTRLLSGLGNGRVRRRPVDLGRETRGPFVVAASDGAEENMHCAHRCPKASSGGAVRITPGASANLSFEAETPNLALLRRLDRPALRGRMK